MDWIPYIASGAAVFISTICAILHSGRSYRGIPREVNIHEAAIVDLHRKNAAMRKRLDALERAAKRQKGPTDAS
jgi:hypothetical protein